MASAKINRLTAILTPFVVLFTLVCFAFSQRTSAERSLEKATGVEYTVQSSGAVYSLTVPTLNKDTTKDNWFIADESSYSGFPNITLNVTFPDKNSPMTIWSVGPNVNLYSDEALTEKVTVGSKNFDTMEIFEDHLKLELLLGKCSTIADNTTIGKTYYLVFEPYITSTNDASGERIVVEFVYTEKTYDQEEEPSSQKKEEPTSQKQEEPTSQKQEEPTSQKQEEPAEPDKPAEKLNGVVKGPDGKWGYYKNDVLQEKYTGFQKNEYGYWYIVNGYVDFDRNDILRDGENGWWKVEGGKVNFKYTGVAKNKYGWWRVEGGLVNFNAQGIYKNDYGWWKTTDGKVTFKENGVFKNEYGWWKVEDSKVNFKYTGVAKNEYGWWRIEKGKVNFKFTGIAKNEYGTWYINKGKVDFNKNGKVKYDGKVYKVTNGKAKLA